MSRIQTIIYTITRTDGSVWNYRADHNREQHREYIATCATVLQPGERLSYVVV